MADNWDVSKYGLCKSIFSRELVCLALAQMGFNFNSSNAYMIFFLYIGSNVLFDSERWFCFPNSLISYFMSIRSILT